MFVTSAPTEITRSGRPGSFLAPGAHAGSKDNNADLCDIIE